MTAYIKALYYISPAGADACKCNIDDLPKPEAGYLKCVEPDYKKYIDPMVSRRMSRVVKMGIFAAKSCLDNAKIAMPDAIITGTGLGCIEDTEKFLITMIKNKEKFLNPTPFIQSTHNTVSSQISLYLKCHAYNITYSHRGLSFESALNDCILMLKEKVAENILLGGIDELTQNSFTIQKRLGLWKHQASNGKSVIEADSKGSVGGESAVFFVMTDKPTPENSVGVVAMKTWAGRSDALDINRTVQDFLNENALQNTDVDVLLTGNSGDMRHDGIYTSLHRGTFPHTPELYFKNLCGDHQTASAFALALGTEILKNKQWPAFVQYDKMPDKKTKHLLIYNHFQNINHAFILLRHESL